VGADHSSIGMLSRVSSGWWRSQVAMLMEKAGVFMATGGRECDGLHGEAGQAPFPPPEACTRTERDRLGACSDPNLDYRYFTETHSAMGGPAPNTAPRLPDVRGLKLDSAGDTRHPCLHLQRARSTPERMPPAVAQTNANEAQPMRRNVLHSSGQA
jgi:hypothetical protein